MFQTIRSSERGQALILLVLGVVALLGFTALAIDGGMVYADRRHAQNASDAASLAGGSAAAMSLENSHMKYTNWSCGSARMSAAVDAAAAAAQARAQDNAYTIDNDISDGNGVDATGCENGYNNGSWIDKYIDIKTAVTTETPMSFAQFAFKGPMKNTVIATTRLYPRMNLAFGYAVVAVRVDCPNTNDGGVHYDGTPELIVVGGGVFSNACMEAKGSFGVDVDGDIMCVGEDCYTEAGGAGTISPEPEEAPLRIPREAYYIPPPDCSGLPDRGEFDGGSGTIQPGRYSRISINSHDVVTMQPGLYCLSGEFTVNGGAELSGDGLTIFMQKEDNSFDTAGGATIRLTGPTSPVCDECPPAIPGVLIYSEEGNTADVKLTGNSESYYEGVVYAPSSHIRAGGNDDTLAIRSQLIGDTVLLYGTARVEVHFDGEKLYEIPTRITLFK